MKIREKLLLGFGLYIFLAAILGFFAYKDLRTIGTRLVLVETADDITNTVLEVRRYEKNFLIYRDRQNLVELRKYLDILKQNIDNIKSEIVSEMGADSFSTLKRSIASYESLIARIAKTSSAHSLIEEMRVTAREIQLFTQNLAKKERADIASTIEISIKLLFLALVLVVALGTAINVKLAKSIATPILTLEKITKKIGMGDFSEIVEVKGKDEIASLERSFNQMEEKLKNALSSLEHVVKKMHEKQAQLVEAEKLAAVGKLAAGIAHEINNPLTSVLTFSNLMLEQCPPEDPRRERLKLMARETERARTIVRQLLNFGREIKFKPVMININRPVGEIIDSLIAQEAFKDIHLNVHLAENLPDIYADPALIGQVVLNIVLNAIHAITPPGSIDIETRAVEGFVEIVFCDSGHGIQPELVCKIFEPFFTTKDSSKGTGLGLPVSYGIIKKHGGNIEVTSTVGKGSTFTVRLPING